MGSGRGNADFKAATVRTIRDRASYRCIVPGCKVVTMGPGDKSHQTASTGTACHIYSAGKNGPRGRGGLTDEQLRDPENGVWACATHGRLIDTNSGGAFPATLLKSWKALQEARIRRERDGQPTSEGWLDSFKLENTPLFEPDATIKFGKATLIQGGSVGKTALLEWLATALGHANSHRWANLKDKIFVSATLYSPEEKEIVVELGGSSISASVDGRKCAELPSTVNCIFVREESLRWSQADDEDDAYLAKLLGAQSDTIRSLVSDIKRRGTPWGRKFDFYNEPKHLEDDEDGNAVYSDRETEWVLRHGGPSGRPLCVLSGSEAARVVIEFAAALARERSTTMPALLILDGNGWNFDDANMELIGEYLPTQPFQTVMTATGDWRPPETITYNEWKRAELNRVKGDTRIVETEW